MKKREYYYIISKDNSPSDFKQACKKLEGSDILNGFDKMELLVDVDGSTIQVYSKEDKEVVVVDDYDFGYVYVDSDVDVSTALEDEEKVA